MARPLEQAIDLLRAATYAVALTGAGLSTPSGIPDFRGDYSGLWRHADPLSVASIWAFHDDPGLFYGWIKPVILRAMSARPNSAHVTLAEWEQAGRLKAVITQNIDSLHQQAGSRRVLEVHGHTRTATCMSCRHTIAADPLWSAVVNGGQLISCPQCGGVLKPDVILFGEPLPYATISAAQQETLTCDLMLVIGTSLEVMPAADLPLLAKRRGARIILVNLTPTPLDEHFDVVIHTDVVKALRALRRAVLE
jgi:NAD-dependent deacetylase